MGETCSTYTIFESKKSLKEEITWEIYVKTGGWYLIGSQRNRVGLCTLDSSAWGQGPVAGPCEQGNEISDFDKRWVFTAAGERLLACHRELSSIELICSCGDSLYSVIVSWVSLGDKMLSL